MKPRQFAGLAILLTVAIIVAATQFWPGDDNGKSIPAGNPGPDLTIDGLIGGKIAFLQDPDVIRVLQEKYGLTVKFERVGSIAMIERCKEGEDYCWPSSQNSGEVIKGNLGSSMLASEIIFNSPLVLYTWTPIADALITQGIVEKSGETYYIADLARFISMIDDGTQWSAIGLPQMYGPVRILTSDPTKSNTGNSFAGLLANTLNGGVVVDQASVGGVQPDLVTFFSKLGLLPDTTTLLFEQFLSLGMGACPLIAAYESNLIEYGLVHQSPDAQNYIRTNVRTLYPKPTVWTSQPLIALTEGGQRFMTALRDPEIQRIGWEHHGFRSAVPGVINDPAVLNQPAIPQSIDSVIPMPGPAAMDQIIGALQGTVPTSDPPASPSAIARHEEPYIQAIT
jgi:hypothetical protein